MNILFSIAKNICKVFYRKPKFLGVENLPSSPTIIVGNHAQIHGPLIGELYMPTKTCSWITGEMLSVKEFTKYAYKDFWSKKPKFIRWFFKGISYIISPFAVFIFKRASVIGVYRDFRILNTYKTTVKKLQEGNSIVIFPESREKYNLFINEFQKNFVDVSKIYYKTTKENLTFTPMYIAPRIKTVIFGKPTEFNSENDYNKEKERIIKYLKDEITSLAKSLPVHTVLPYDNIPRKYHKKSK